MREKGKKHQGYVHVSLGSYPTQQNTGTYIAVPDYLRRRHIRQTPSLRPEPVSVIKGRELNRYRH